MRIKKESNIQMGERIKAARERAGLTQEQLAERIEVSPQYISDLERGVVGISLPTLKRLCLVLAISSDSILFGKETELSAALAEKCRGLSDAQLQLLLTIVDSYTKAIEAERSSEEIR